MGKENMTGIEFHNEMVKVAKKYDTKEMVAVIKKFCDDLNNEISEVINGKTTNETDLLVANCLEDFASMMKKHASMEAMAILGLFNSSFRTEKQKITVKVPNKNKEEK
jgi:hemerythrin-like domain-containing protein